jgi:hypothetical protein
MNSARLILWISIRNLSDDDVPNCSTRRADSANTGHGVSARNKAGGELSVRQKSGIPCRIQERLRTQVFPWIIVLIYGGSSVTMLAWEGFSSERRKHYAVPCTSTADVSIANQVTYFHIHMPRTITNSASLLLKVTPACHDDFTEMKPPLSDIK